MERRLFLRSAGALAALSTVGNVSANNRDAEPSVEAINRTFQRAVVRDGPEGAEQALEKFGLEGTVEASQDFELAKDEESEDEANTQNKYGDPTETDSTLDVGVFSASDTEDEVYVTAHMILRDSQAITRNAWWADDAIGIGFIHQDWAPVGTPSVTATTDHTAKFTTEDVDDDALAATVDIERQGWEYPDNLPDSSVSLSGKFRLRSGGIPSTMWGSYAHTIAWEPDGAIEGISGGTGGIEVQTKAGTSTAWSIAHPVDPEEEL